jgi:hypothetical protein
VKAFCELIHGVFPCGVADGEHFGAEYIDVRESNASVWG